MTAVGLTKFELWGSVKKFEIGRILHFKSEIRNLRLDGASDRDVFKYFADFVSDPHDLSAIVAGNRAGIFPGSPHLSRGEVQSEISNLRFEMQDSSNFKSFKVRQKHKGSPFVSDLHFQQIPSGRDVFKPGGHL